MIAIQPVFAARGNDASREAATASVVLSCLVDHTAGTQVVHRQVAPDAERRRRPARPPSLLAAVASTRTTPSPDLCGPRRAPSDVDGAAGDFEFLCRKKPD